MTLAQAISLAAAALPRFPSQRELSRTMGFMRHSRALCLGAIFSWLALSPAWIGAAKTPRRAGRIIQGGLHGRGRGKRRFLWVQSWTEVGLEVHQGQKIQFRSSYHREGCCGTKAGAAICKSLQGETSASERQRTAWLVLSYCNPHFKLKGSVGWNGKKDFGGWIDDGGTSHLRWVQEVQLQHRLVIWWRQSSWSFQPLDLGWEQRQAFDLWPPGS